MILNFLQKILNCIENEKEAVKDDNIEEKILLKNVVVYV